MTIALVDADVLVYRIGFTTEEVDSNIAIWRLKTMLEDIVDATEAEAYRCFLTSEDKSNYRFDIDPLYKSNRKAEKPKHYNALRSHLINQHNAEVVFGMEADDKLGIEQQEDTIICSIDKDMRQIPGKHYNFVKKEMFEVTPIEALQFFYMQILMGDTADFIEGIRGIGPKKAEKIISPLLTEQDMYNEVMQVYKKHHPEDAFTRVVKAGQLLKIKQSMEEELWRPPVKQDTDQDLKEPLQIS
jgi:5'-3' exonuclease